MSKRDSSEKEYHTLKRTAIYMRVSSDKQAQDGDSIPAQRDALRQYIDNRSDLIYAGEYLDDGVSGTKEDRDELQRLLADVRAGKIDLIIATKLDRIYRSIRHYLNFQDTLDKCGVGWLAIWEPIYDTTTPQGRLIINQMMSIAQFEAENTGQRIKQVQAYKITQGEVISGSTPPGYTIVNKHLVPNDDAQAVQDVFAYYSRTGHLHDTMRYAEHYGIFPRTAPSFKRILMNEVYIGQKRGNSAFCPALVDRELFADVQRKLCMNVKRNQRHTYIFSGLLHCAVCGNVMAGYQCHISSRNKTQINAYRCAKRYSTGGLRRCTNTKVLREYKLDEYMVAHIRPMIKDVVLQWTVKDKPAQDNRRQLAALEKRKSRLKELYVSGLISLDEYKRDRDEVDRSIADMPPICPDKAPNAAKLRQLLDTDIERLYATFSPAERRYFWRAIIDEIRFDQDRTITVTFLPGTN